MEVKYNKPKGFGINHKLIKLRDLRAKALKDNPNARYTAVIETAKRLNDRNDGFESDFEDMDKWVDTVRPMETPTISESRPRRIRNYAASNPAWIIIHGSGSGPVPPTPGTPYVLFEGPAGFTFGLGGTLGTFEQSTDGETWNPAGSIPWDTSTGKLYVRGSGTTALNGISGSFTKVSGNVHSLIDYNQVPDSIPSTQPFSFINMDTFTALFSSCIELQDASGLILPYGTLANEGYAAMFMGCTSLQTAPSLPATTLAESCYASMFQGCTSLTSAPSLPATTLVTACYGWMFMECASLISAPALPALTLAPTCYSGMFSGCTSLTSAPDLPATTLADECYNEMFSGCTSLASAPALPALTLAPTCYMHMFQECTALVEGPTISATTLADKDSGNSGCCEGMFDNCSSMTSAMVPPATVATEHCYSQMFYYCTSLQSIVLPATTLANDCYGTMFRGCESLNYVEAYSTPAYDQAGRMFLDAKDSGTLKAPDDGSAWKTSGDHYPSLPAGWTVEPLP